MEQAYAAIGRAVIFAQLFETALVPIFELFKMQTEPGYREKTGGYISAGAFKVPITNIVKALSATGDIAPDLETRLTAYIADRHTLIHRWVQIHGLPAEDDVAAIGAILELANRVENEAKDLTQLLVGYVVKYAEPEWASTNMEEYKARMAEIFRRAHIDNVKQWQ
ncbi:MAG TPA: hypothetical protein VEJ43_09740 [Pseudolabrys sp.]|nr:hypothetical protein [Pseudolabrys sp.]